MRALETRLRVRVKVNVKVREAREAGAIGSLRMTLVASVENRGASVRTVAAVAQIGAAKAGLITLRVNLIKLKAVMASALWGARGAREMGSRRDRRAPVEGLRWDAARAADKRCNCPSVRCK